MADNREDEGGAQNPLLLIANNMPGAGNGGGQGPPPNQNAQQGGGQPVDGQGGALRFTQEQLLNGLLGITNMLDDTVPTTALIERYLKILAKGTQRKLWFDKYL